MSRPFTNHRPTCYRSIARPHLYVCRKTLAIIRARKRKKFWLFSSSSSYRRCCCGDLPGVQNLLRHDFGIFLFLKTNFFFFSFVPTSLFFISFFRLWENISLRRERRQQLCCRCVYNFNTGRRRKKMEEMIKKKKNETEIYLSLSHFSVGWKKKKNVFSCLIITLEKTKERRRKRRRDKKEGRWRDHPMN